MVETKGKNTLSEKERKAAEADQAKAVNEKQNQEASEARRNTGKGMPSPEEIAQAEQTLMASNVKHDKVHKAREVLTRARGSGVRANQGMQTTETQATSFRQQSPAGASGAAAAIQPTAQVATQRVEGAESQGQKPETETTDNKPNEEKEGV